MERARGARPRRRETPRARRPFADIPWPVPGPSKEAQSFVEALLVKDRTARLGADGWESIFAHPWLADVDVGTLDDKASAPFVPPANGQHVPDAHAIGDFKAVEGFEIEDGDFDEDKWTFVSEKAFGAEIVWYLKWKEKKEAAEGGDGNRRRSSACAIA